MSSHAPTGKAADKHGDGHEHDDGHTHGSFKSYMIGFVLSVILTGIPFWLVMGNVLDNNQLTAVVITLFAVIQIVVHMVYFLHMDFRSEGGWSMLALIFTVIVVVICLAGSLWVMFHLNTNMMPLHDMEQMRR